MYCVYNECSVQTKHCIETIANLFHSQVMQIIDTILEGNDELPARKVTELLKSEHNITLSVRTVRKAIRSGWTYGKPR